MSSLVAIVFAGTLAYRAYTHVRAALAGRSRRLRSLGATPVTVAELVAMAGAARAELGPGVFDQHVVASGVAEPSEHGPLEAPFSATPCVWYRATTLRVVQDGKGRTRHEVDADVTSRQGFRLVDGGAELHVLAGATPIEGATQTVDEVVESPDEGIDLGLVRIVSNPDRTIRREWVVAAGTRLTVVADVRDVAGRLVAKERPDAPIRITTETSSEAVQADERAERGGWRSGALYAAAALAALLFAVIGPF
ncbi:E3 ubiquitin ligase [Pseudonocardia hierapolitana]|uniref:RING-type E3 ubiquitin transferase n=1 Tax=Pseudonocardia hierapolitana TaxID=1128676 RepID=A0A561T1I4_9PSEU|nr:E3 ubiquitin ligase family protein [Pseudonocardia hierapolitana]TWF80972.1 E3 ubiquitin ligase [Pseudonocardia hierapolitana]